MRIAHYDVHHAVGFYSLSQLAERESNSQRSDYRSSPSSTSVGACVGAWP